MNTTLPATDASKLWFELITRELAAPSSPLTDPIIPLFLPGSLLDALGDIAERRGLDRDAMVFGMLTSIAARELARLDRFEHVYEPILPSDKDHA